MKLNIYVKPRSSKGPLIEVGDDGLVTVSVRESAIENKANNATIELLSKHYKIPKTSITIVRGHKSKQKLIEIIDK